MKGPRPKAQFLSPLVAEWVSERVRRLREPLMFYSAEIERIITVPAGTESDLGSVPRLPFAYWLFGGVADEAAVIHDALYSGRYGVSRKVADAVFKEAMKASGTGWKRYPMTWAVRLFGGSRYTEPHQESMAP